MKLQYLKKRMNASFTIEATYVFWIVLFSLSFVIRVAFRERNKSLSGFLTGEAAESATRIETVYDSARRPGFSSSENMLNSVDQIEAYVKGRLSGIPGLSGAEVSVEKESGRIKASLESGEIDRTVEQKSRDPENWMRMTTIIESIAERIKKK
jgi:hypothetical protein